MLVPAGSWDWWLLLLGGIRIEQLKGQAAKPAYFCVLSYSLSTGGGRSRKQHKLQSLAPPWF